MTSIEAFNSLKDQSIKIDEPHRLYRLSYDDIVYFAYLSSNYTDLYLLFSECRFFFPPTVASKYDEAVEDNKYHVKARYTLLLNQSIDNQSQTISFLRKPIENTDYVFIVCDLGYVYGQHPTGSYCVIHNTDGSETISNPINIHIGIPYNNFIPYWSKILINGSNNNSAELFDYPMRNDRYRLPIFRIIQYPPQQVSPELSKYTDSNMPPNISVLESLPRKVNTGYTIGDEIRRKQRLELSSAPQVISINQPDLDNSISSVDEQSYSNVSIQPNTPIFKGLIPTTDKAGPDEKHNSSANNTLPLSSTTTILKPSSFKNIKFGKK